MVSALGKQGRDQGDAAGHRDVHGRPPAAGRYVVADAGMISEDCGHRVIRVLRKGAREGEDPAHRGHRGDPGCLPGRPGSQRRSARLAAADGSPCWPPPVGGSARLTSGSWCAAWPAPPGSARGSSSRRAACATWRSPSPWTPGPSCATSRITPAARSRTTRRYDHTRDSLDRNAAYAVAAYLA
jgi:hypothetical protein